MEEQKKQAAEPVAWRGSLAQVVLDVPLPKGSYKYQSGFVDAKEAILQALRDAGFDKRAAPAIQQPQDGTTLATIREAVLTYYDALTARQHGGVAMDKAFHAIEDALGMCWQDEALIKRSALAKKGGT